MKSPARNQTSAAKRMLAAVDRLLAAADEARKARDELDRLTGVSAPPKKSKAADAAGGRHAG